MNTHPEATSDPASSPHPGRGRLAGKTAVVVGAGQTDGETVGNGRAVALLFAREGARLLLVDRDLAAAEATADLVRAEGGEAHTHQADISIEDDCAALAARAEQDLGRIDVLHNNVGILGADDYATDLLEPAWQQIMDVNLKGMWLTCKHVLPRMRAQGSGAITNVSSIGSRMLNPNLLAYSLSKVGVNGLTQALALDNAKHGIRVNAVLPGIIDTPLGVDAVVRARGLDRDQVAADRASAVPLGRQGTAWEVAQATLFLASDDASFITGVLMPVDGGSTLLVGSLPLEAYGSSEAAASR